MAEVLTKLTGGHDFDRTSPHLGHFFVVLSAEEKFIASGTKTALHGKISATCKEDRYSFHSLGRMHDAHNAVLGARPTFS